MVNSMKSVVPIRFLVILIAVGALHVCVAGLLWGLSGDKAAPVAQPPAESGQDFQIADPDASGSTPIVNRPPNQQVSPPSSVSAARTHVVAPGESYWGIADKYGTTVAKLKAANGHTPNHVLQPGQSLKIP